MWKLFKKKNAEQIPAPLVKKEKRLEEQLYIAQKELEKIKPEEDSAAYIKKFHQIIDLKQKIGNEQIR